MTSINWLENVSSMTWCEIRDLVEVIRPLGFDIKNDIDPVAREDAICFLN